MQYGDVYIIILHYEEWKIKEEINFSMPYISYFLKVRKK